MSGRLARIGAAAAAPFLALHAFALQAFASARYAVVTLVDRARYPARSAPSERALAVIGYLAGGTIGVVGGPIALTVITLAMVAGWSVAYVVDRRRIYDGRIR